MLRRQEELHKELVAKELRLQEEILTRKTRDETEKLKKSYAEDLARNVNAERAAILNKLQETFTREKKIIEDRYAQQLRTKSKELSEILAKERKQRVTVRWLFDGTFFVCYGLITVRLNFWSLFIYGTVGNGKLPCATACAEHGARDLVDVRSVQPPGSQGLGCRIGAVGSHRSGGPSSCRGEIQQTLITALVGFP